MQIRLNDGSYIPLPTEDAKAANFLADIVQNSGYVRGTDQRADWGHFVSNFLVGKDSVSMSNIRPLLQSSVEVILREPLEPIMNILPLFTRVMAKGLSTQVLAGALGAVHAGDVDEHQAYPEVFFTVGGGVQTAYIGKSGIAASFTQEALRYSTWDIMAINLRLMKNAMARHKEQKAIAFLRELGTTVFDNLAPASSVHGVLTGRGIDGSANGAPTMDDLLKGMTFMAEEGFMPNILLVNPVTYLMWIQDPVMRNMMLAHGGGDYFGRWSGNPGPLDPWNNGAMGSQGPSLGNQIVPGGNAAGETATGLESRMHGMNSAPQLPSYFPWSFNVMVSPHVPFDSTTGLTDMFLLSSGNVGYHLVDEELTQVQWADETLETIKVKLRERYGFAVAHEGQSVGVIKNVPVKRNFWDGTMSFSSLAIDSEIDPLEDLSSVL